MLKPARLILALLFFTSALKVNAQAQKAEIQIDSIMKSMKAVGLAAVVVKDGKIIYQHSFGYKNLESKTPLGNNDIFRIASISKSFSTVSIMQLVEQKKLSLDDDVSKLVGFKIQNPKFPGTLITLKMLLSHRSSLNDSEGYFSLDFINPATNANWAKCYNNYKPGTDYQYCNLNFNLVGTIIERVSGERFDQYVKHHILDPLKLYGGYCVDSLDKSRFATLYEYNTKTDSFTAADSAYASRSKDIRNYKMGYSTPVFSPTGGMKISAVDLARYSMMHMNFGESNGVRIIPKKLSKLMQKKISEKEGYGMSIMNFNDLVAGVHLTGHTGSAYGLYSAMFFNPQKKFGIVVITTGCNVPESEEVHPILKQTINCLYDNFIR